MESNPQSFDRTAQSAFKEYLQQLKRGVSLTDDEFLRAHPQELRSELRQMIADHRRVQEEADAPRAAHAFAGMVLNGFRLIREIGRGGTATVWEAEQISLKRSVAIKFLQSNFQLSPNRLRRFQREARAGGRLAHENIARTLFVEQWNGFPYIVQELISGGRTLADHIQQMRARRPAADEEHNAIVELVRKLAHALQYAHDEGVIHRDLKPSNILLDSELEPKVADFGLAHLEHDAAITDPGEWIGSPHYMSPEQASPSSREIDGRADVFSLGAVLFELLTLRRAFDGDTRGQVLGKLRSQDPVHPRRLRSQIPADLAVIAMKALEKDPARRYSSMAALAADLTAFLEHRPIAAHPPNSLARLKKWLLRKPATAAAILALFITSTSLLFALLALHQAQSAANRLAMENEILASFEHIRDLEKRMDTLWPIRPERNAAYREWLEDMRQQQTKRANFKRQRQTESLSYLHENLDQWLALMDDIEDEQSGWIDGKSIAHSWGVGLRLDFSERLQSDLRSDSLWRQAWQETIAELSQSSRYAGMELPPQPGLWPLGENPNTGLFEFVHMASGRPPRRDHDSGKIILTDQTGIVLILLPPTIYKMGTSQEIDSPNYGQYSRPDTRPIREVSLSAYFISKYETSQAQWIQLTNGNPSYWRHDPNHRVLPLERVNWHDAHRILSWHDLNLPSEAQWERAARGESSANISSSPDNSEALDRINFADTERYHSVPVFDLPPNPFGMYNVFGNVEEWCLDWYGSYDNPAAPDSGEITALGTHARTRSCRGGAFSTWIPGINWHARSRYRPNLTRNTIGIRAARQVLTYSM